MWCHECVAGFREIAIRGATDEPTVARRVEPSANVAARRDRDGLLRLLMISARTTTPVAASPSVTMVTELTSASALSASAVAELAASTAARSITPEVLARRHRRSIRLLHRHRRLGGRRTFVARRRRLLGGWRRELGLTGAHRRSGRRSVFIGSGAILCARHGTSARVIAIRIWLVNRLGGGTVGRTLATAAARWAATFGHATIGCVGWVLRVRAHELIVCGQLRVKLNCSVLQARHRAAHPHVRADICHAHRARRARWNRASDESRRLRCLLPLGARTSHAVPATRLLRLGLDCGPPFARGERAATQTYLPEGRRRGRTSGWIRVSHLAHSGATLKLRRPTRRHRPGGQRSQSPDVAIEPHRLPL